MTFAIPILLVLLGFLTLFILVLAATRQSNFWRKLGLVFICVIIVLNLKIHLPLFFLSAVIWTITLGFCLYIILSKEKLRFSSKSLLLLASVFIVLVLPSSTVLHQVKTEVGIIKNLEKDGWYWTQFQLPSGGELMTKTSFEGYRYWQDLDLSRVEFLGWQPFFGRFCPCGETIPNKYVFLPREYPDNPTLVFFPDDGSKTVWEIEIPPGLQTPEPGETIAQATIYYH